MNDIFKYCIRVNGISSYYPIYDEVSQHVLEGDPEYVRTFGWNNGKVYVAMTEDKAAEHVIELKMADGDEEKKFTLLAIGYN